ncbi:hypothetical protein ACX0HA_05070 [Flavobacterium hauense]
MLFLFSCNHDDVTINEKDTLSLNYNNEEIVFDKILVINVENTNHEIIGKSIIGYIYYKNALTVTKYKLELHFYNNNNIYQLFGVAFQFPDISSDDPVSGSEYYNYFDQPEDFPFVSNIVFSEGKLTGTFSGELMTVDGGISISGGKIDVAIPE